jgi:hypothetical protein
MHKSRSLRQHYAQSNKQKVVETMTEYTHNDDVADLLYAREQEIIVLKEALAYCNAELDRLEKELARGV